MLFKDLAEYFGKIESTRARNEKTLILAEILKEATIEEVDKLVYLALGGLRPAFDRLEFEMGEALILRAMGATETQYQKVGDLGELVEQFSNHKFSNSQMTINQIYEELEKIARESGVGSQERKVAGLAKLIKKMDAASAKYIVRMVEGKLRLGFSDKTVIDALSYLESETKKFSEMLDRAYQVRPDTGILAKKVKELGVVRAVAEIDVSMGTPIVPALAQRLKTPKEMIEKMGKVICEGKYDGTRVQIHFKRSEFENSNNQAPNHKQILNSNNQTMMFETEAKPAFWVRTFTRNLDESSAMFPELENIGEQIKAEEVILDSEAVGYDPKTNKLVPFQLTITRKRKHKVEEASSSVPLRFFVFDIMYLNGKSLIHLPLCERRKILSETIGEGEVLKVDEYIETDDPDVLREYHRQQLEVGLEGALVKQIDGEYMPGRTGFNWVKFKESEDSRAKLADTLDVVIMGYYLGKGKRQKFGVGAFLVGILDDRRKTPDSSEVKIVTLAKVGTGISDQVFGELGERLRLLKIPNPKLQITNKFKILNSNNQTMMVPEILEPDVWVEPRIVVEVAADEITVSPTHTSGYALRFPRMVKFRDDKGVGQITTLEEVRGMYEQG